MERTTMQDWWARSGVDPTRDTSEAGVEAWIAGDDPVLSVRHRVGDAAAAALSAAGAQAALLHCEHGGPPQSVGVVVVDAATTLLGFALQQAPAAGAIAALRRREVEGGSWLVRASLAHTAMWIQGGGLVAEPDSAGGLGDVAARQVTTPTAWGSLTHLAPVVRMSATPCRWDLPPQPLGTSSPAWQ